MPRTRARLIASLVVIGVLLVGGTAVAYHAIVERWGADPRGTLIAAAAVGISLFISMNLLLRWDERRRRRAGRNGIRVEPPAANGPQVADPTK
jgi:hypothetical protein